MAVINTRCKSPVCSMWSCVRAMSLVWDITHKDWGWISAVLCVTQEVFTPVISLHSVPHLWWLCKSVKKKIWNITLCKCSAALAASRQSVFDVSSVAHLWFRVCQVDEDWWTFLGSSVTSVFPSNCVSMRPALGRVQTSSIITDATIKEFTGQPWPNG